MTTYFKCNAVCTKNDNDGFEVGDVYEVLEVNDTDVIENDRGQEMECAFFSGGLILCHNSEFKEC